ncbi:MAG: general secretion pathway protein J [Myxococcota bacterium]|jgi:general secretion pathway protein J
MIARRAGFTLIEVIVALGIMVVIGTLAFSTLSSSIQLRDILEEDDALARSARVALGRLTQELSLAYLSENGNPNTFQTVFVGREEGGGAALWFASTSHRRTYKNSRESDLTEISMWLEDDPDDDTHSVLLHRESGVIDQEPDEGGTILPLARRVTRFQVFYLDNQTAEWMDEWDSGGVEASNRLPRAVQIVLGLARPDPDDEDDFVEQIFIRTVILERADPIVGGDLNPTGNR